jgi:hypothetical protein
MTCSPVEMSMDSRDRPGRHPLPGGALPRRPEDFLLMAVLQPEYPSVGDTILDLEPQPAARTPHSWPTASQAIEVS